MTITRKCGAVIFLPILLAGIFACNLDDSIRFSRIDITGARALMVAPLTGTIKGGRSAAPGSLTFVKILADSSIEAIDVTDASGNPTAGIVPSMVMEVNSSFVIIIIDQVPYLVSKIDGSRYGQ